MVFSADAPLWVALVSPVGVKKQFEEGFRNPSQLDDLPDRTPGEILFLQ